MYLVEVDIHALELELGSAVVPMGAVSGYSNDARPDDNTYTPLLSKPCSPEIICL